MGKCRYCGHSEEQHGVIYGPNSIGQMFRDMKCTFGSTTYYIGGESDTILKCKCPGFKRVSVTLILLKKLFGWK